MQIQLTKVIKIVILLVYLSQSGMVDLDKVKTAMKEIANPTDRLIINRSYYSMYHAARAAVYVQLQLDV
ncbi:MAG TPA: hypothetical protein EYP22_10010, partial [Methanosarcinales archaeon]|nr:hypothetical protein [Methanosarcinales archaeon]